MEGLPWKKNIFKNGLNRRKYVAVGGLMAEITDEEKLRRMVRDFLKNCPGENAGQFIADRLSLAWSLGYKAGKRDAKSK